MESIGTTDLADIPGKRRICCLFCHADTGKIVQEKRSAGGKYAVLLMAGLLTCKVEKIILLRILIMESILMCGTLGITVVIGSFSMLAIIPGFVLILLHYGISCSKLSGRNTA